MRACSLLLLAFISAPVLADDIFDPKSKLKVEAAKGVGSGLAWTHGVPPHRCQCKDGTDSLT